MCDTESEKKFWRLLADYESLSYQQAVAVRHGDLRLFTEAQSLKSSLLQAWLRLGWTLRIDALSHPELGRRLQEITLLESETLHRIKVAREVAHCRLRELKQTRQRLENIRGCYHEVDLPPAEAAGLLGRG